MEDPDLDAVAHGYEGGYNDVTCVEKINLKRNASGLSSWWYGAYKKVDKAKDADCKVIRIG